MISVVLSERPKPLVYSMAEYGHTTSVSKNTSAPGQINQTRSLSKDSSVPTLLMTAGSGMMGSDMSKYDKKEMTNSLYESRVTYKY